MKKIEKYEKYQSNKGTALIVCDIDDTISFTKNRDWKNATPNTELIEILNKLHKSGYKIHYVTSRGNLSFKGNREEAENYYRPIIENWFKEHNVLYDKLSFQKDYALYYIDDKSLRPNEIGKLNKLLEEI